MTGMNKRTMDALTARGLDIELADKMGFSSDGASGDALVIPFVREGAVIRRKFRTFGEDKRFWQDKSQVRSAWNEDCLRDESLLPHPVIITEGELDALAAIQAGFLRTISVPDGAPPPGERSEADLLGSAKYDWLKPILPLLTAQRAPEIILAVDGDDNGAALLQDLAILLGRARCKFLVYPLARSPEQFGRPRLKDLNEVLEVYGERGMRDCIARASWMKVEGVHRMSELPPLPPSVVYDLGYCGLPETAQHFKPRLGDLSVLTGVPGYGKSTWANDIWCRIADRYHVRVAWASFEQAPQRDHKRAFRAWVGGVPEYRQSEQELRRADEWIDEHHRFIVPNEDEDVTLDWFFDRAEAAVIQHGCKALVLDPWNEMDHARANHESITEYTGRSIKSLKRFAKAMQVHITVVAHPAKMKRENGKWPIPSLYDISDSAHWYNKPDLGAIIHRPDPDTTLLKVQKSRYHDIIGKPGDVKLRFDTCNRHFNEISNDPRLDPDQSTGASE